MNKKYGLGIIVGRFQVLHLGHVDMIDRAIDLCEEVGILIGSSQESGTLKNPLTYEKRCEVIHQIYGDRVKTFPLPDIGVGNVSAWGDYVLENVKNLFGKLPDVMVSGEEDRRTSWLDDNSGIDEVFVPKTIDISASQMIQYLIEDDRASWEKYIDPRLYPMYEELKQIVNVSKDNLDTRSL